MMEKPTLERSGLFSYLDILQRQLQQMAHTWNKRPAAGGDYLRPELVLKRTSVLYKIDDHVWFCEACGLKVFSLENLTEEDFAAFTCENYLIMKIMES